MFEYNQKNLDRAIETLSQYLESDITLENIDDIRQIVQYLSRYYDHRRKVRLAIKTLMRINNSRGGGKNCPPSWMDAELAREFRFVALCLIHAFNL